MIFTKKLFGFSTKKLFIGANWKSNNTKLQTEQLLTGVFNKLKHDPQKVDVVLAPAFVHFHVVKSVLENKNVSIAAQNCSAYDFGAYTGQISPEHIKDLGIEWVILGHSERRTHFKESSQYIAEKTRIALKHNLKVIFCFGENLLERRSQLTEEVIRSQLKPLLLMMREFPEQTWVNNLVLAYEPVWAIGTGVNASSLQAEQACAYTRSFLAESVPNTEDIRIIYGGSVTEKNTNQLIKQANIDGFLVGGASLKEGFTKIVNQTTKQRPTVF